MLARVFADNDARQKLGHSVWVRCFLPLLLCVACEGVISDGPDDWSPPPIVIEDGAFDFECSTDAPNSPPLRRLTRTQLSQTLHDVLVRLLGPTEASAVEGGLDGALSAVPQDQRLAHDTQAGQQLFSRSDSSIGAVGVDANYRLGLAIGAALSTDARLREMGFECAADGMPGNDDACIDEIIDVVGRLTHRRPLDAETHAFFPERGVHGRKRLSSPPPSQTC